jgi:hypothetical protein
MSTTTTAISRLSSLTSSDPRSTARSTPTCATFPSRSRPRHNQAVAHIDAELGAAALKMMEQNISAELTTAADSLG